MVMRPLLLRPPLAFIGARRLFSGLSVVISSNVRSSVNLMLGVVGRYFLIPIVILFISALSFQWLDIHYSLRILLNASVEVDCFAFFERNVCFLKRWLHSYCHSLLGLAHFLLAYVHYCINHFYLH